MCAAMPHRMCQLRGSTWMCAAMPHRMCQFRGSTWMCAAMPHRMCQFRGSTWMCAAMPHRMCQFRGSTWVCAAIPIAPPGTDTIRKSKTFISRSQPTCAVRGLLYIDGLRCAPPILRTTPLILRTNRFRWVLIRVAEHFGDFAARYFAAIDVESVAQVFVLLQRPHDAAIREFQYERQRRAVERVGRRARHRAGHVGNAVVHDAVDGVYRIGVA